ncbi:uncharacterized protein UV8b_05097 [Ustilaginoidea virens]|uniref:AB hydrolase-1 domain-containing protein n=1 Tax=Ustilaginoidea virens TaxID=1159556 RepID=A0A8E5MIL1_USTVR|nr:uncharacterized protein UV8b_05097 [Ustilaginoidea virens]QUC20856.1 hypothetical protein UV8b_05097 [Ustilaginoidea virens]
MSQFQFKFRWDYVLLTGAACLSACYHLRPVLLSHDRVKPRRVVASLACEAATSTLPSSPTSSASAPPYPPDAFPGGRHVETAYGTTNVFEWGPEDGEKVLLVHGIATPCVALGDMAKRFVAKGCRVMLFDLFGRGYSDSPSDLIHDDRLYTTQILLALASSPLAWTGSSAFHILGYSLGGALAASFAAYHANLLRSATLVCPGGLVRPSHVSFKSRLLYSNGLLPACLVNRLARWHLEPKPGSASAHVPHLDGSLDELNARDAGAGTEAEAEAEAVDFDQVPICSESALGPKVGDVVRWQLRNNAGFVPAYVSSIRHAPIYGQHGGVWEILGRQLRLRRENGNLAGLPGGRGSC